MNRPMFAICFRCGKRARIVSRRYDWDTDEDICGIRCECGLYSEAPLRESRILRIDVNDPYVENAHYDLLAPGSWETEEISDRARECMRTW